MTLMQALLTIIVGYVVCFPLVLVTVKVVTHKEDQ